MIKMFFSLLIIMFSFTMLFLSNPLSMGLMILIQTLLVCLISSINLSTYWFSYIMFLTFLGGLLVMFIYVSSIASNEYFKISFYMMMMMCIFSMFSLLLSIYTYKNLYWLNLNISNLEMNKFFNYLIFFNNENKINLSKLYNNQTFLMMMMMMIYLFIALIAVVKITNIFFGPLRSTN
uniref:NADH-ubiquinone oxidoreductase chain 6 n=1 Tax=Tyspanodes striata TaxID=1661355 RepID=A0A190RVY1_9NEOP|nr:NADH dehydrogenase subunit 6 [Tyspanodes striata]AKJ25920.1 NADH dehydrogenase subunit 6 [Tyspanodes striata]